MLILKGILFFIQNHSFVIHKTLHHGHTFITHTNTTYSISQFNTRGHPAGKNSSFDEIITYMYMTELCIDMDEKPQCNPKDYWKNNIMK